MFAFAPVAVCLHLFALVHPFAPVCISLHHFASVRIRLHPFTSFASVCTRLHQFSIVCIRLDPFALCLHPFAAVCNRLLPCAIGCGRLLVGMMIQCRICGVMQGELSGNNQMAHSQMLIVITISVHFHMGFHFTISRHLQSETNDNKR